MSVFNVEVAVLNVIKFVDRIQDVAHLCAFLLPGRAVIKLTRISPPTVVPVLHISLQSGMTQ